MFFSGQATAKSLFVPLFLIFWTFFWGKAGFELMGRLLWNLFGEEQLRIDEHFVSIRRSVFGQGKSKLYRASHIERWRVDCQSPRFNQLGPREVTCLAFDYGADTIRFGVGIKEAEARSILRKIIEHFPAYKDKSAF